MQIVILHGWKVDGKRYGGLASLLRKKGFDVHVPDMPGFGTASLPTHPLNVDDYAKWIKDYLDKKKIRKTILVGHSFGGRVGIVFASKYPQYVTKLVLTGTPGVLLITKRKLNLFLLLAKVGGFVFALPIINIFSTLARKVLYQLAGASDYLVIDGVMRETFKKVISFDLVPSMKKVTIPTLLLWGSEDGDVPVEVGNRMKTIIKHATLEVVPGQHHGFPMENPKVFGEKVVRFIFDPPS